jgi:hypothetical protein
MQPQYRSRYAIVERRPDPGRWLWPCLALAWGVSLIAVFAWAQHRAAPQLGAVERAHDRISGEWQRGRAELEALRQQVATLERSDQISRVANRQLQGTLAERERSIATLRADLAMYERTAGSGPRVGLQVQSASFRQEAAGSWRYRIVLAQARRERENNVGRLQFAIEGVRDGRIATVGWNELHQAQAAPAQGYAFRYFQQLAGSVMLPEGFIPQRVRVRLHGEDESREQTLAWNRVAATGGI